MFVKRFKVFFLFLLLVLVIYSPLINKSFSSDDFQIIRRVVFAEHGILIKGFFRPLSDITLYYLNYCFVGFNPLWYNIYNFISHACIAYLVFLIAGRIPWIPADKRRFFSWVSALLFITYPFHNEPVVWAVGRASLMAGLFGALSILAALSDINLRLKYLLVCVFYFIAMSGYESVLVLPGIILLMIYDPKQPLRTYIPWIGWMGITLIIHLVVRVWISGVFTGVYGAEMMSGSSTSYLMKGFKVLGRVLLPPMEHSKLLVALFGVEVIILSACIVALWKKRREKPEGFYGILRFTGMLALALLIPVMFGISTRTYEGDRLFYFPSLIVAWWVSWMMTTLLSKKAAFACAGVFIAYQLIFLLITVYNWHNASRITRDMVSTIKGVKEAMGGRKHVYVVNIPEEYEGAHVLRNGFYDALWWKGVDTSGITAVNYIRTEQRKAAGSLEPRRQTDGRVFIPPFVDLSFSGRTPGVFEQDGKYTLDINPARDRILYWDGNSLKELSLP